MKICGIFAVSIVAIAVAAPAFADIASKAYVDDVVATKESTANKVGTVPSDWNKYTYGGSEEQAGQALYPSVYATQQMISGTMGNKVNTTEGTQQNTLMVRNNLGRATKGTSSDISVTTTNGVTNVTVTHATAADSATSATSATNDASGNAITTTYQTKSDSTAVDGNYIQAGTGVGANLGLLDSAVDAISDKIGTVTTGKTVVEMISDASYDDTALAGRVTANETAITTLNGSATTAGSVAKKISDAITSGTANGTIAVNGTDVAVTGLGSAAYTASTDYDATGTAAGLIGALNGAVGTGNVATGNVVTSVTQADGLVTVTRGNAVNAVASVASSGDGNVITGISLNEDGKTIDFQKGINAIPKPSGNCTDCVLHYVGGATNEFSWEEIGR